MSEPWNLEELLKFIEELPEPRKNLINCLKKSKNGCSKQKDILKHMTRVDDGNKWGYTKLRAQKGLISKECENKDHILRIGEGKGDERKHCIEPYVYKLLTNK